MAIGERIKRIRNFRKLTQKDLGLAIGFDENTADVRVAQYETGTRTPKEKYINAIAAVLQISPSALSVPDIDNYIGVLQTLFALEDIYGLKINSIDGELCLALDKSIGTSYLTMFDMFSAWQTQSEKLKNGEISQEDYDNWRYNYPKIEAEHTRAALDARWQDQQK
ncbi:MAG: Helix-turn-helix domain protein [Firmicutes bacterium ADurb.Bin248]|jgi:transcriptional regulator with XRE-family HTH domain|nr:MAG: Helix-turn-helix domain protein [Firmicutes bacterium ADurb.Bin248]